MLTSPTSLEMLKNSLPPPKSQNLGDAKCLGIRERCLNRIVISPIINAIVLGLFVPLPCLAGQSPSKAAAN